MTDIASRPWDAICEMQAADGAMTKAGFVRRYKEIVAAAKKDDQPAMTTDALRAAMYEVTATTDIMHGGALSGTESLKQRYSRAEAERHVAQQYVSMYATTLEVLTLAAGTRESAAEFTTGTATVQFDCSKSIKGNHS